MPAAGDRARPSTSASSPVDLGGRASRARGQRVEPSSISAIRSASRGRVGLLRLLEPLHHLELVVLERR